MNNRHLINVVCPKCKNSYNGIVYGIGHLFTCTCGHMIDSGAYTGIPYEDVGIDSIKELIKNV